MAVPHAVRRFFDADHGKNRKPTVSGPVWLLVGAWLGCALGSYAMGSIRFGLLASRLFRTVDPRAIGSKSYGATNVLRTGSKKAAAFTLLGDAAKGAVSVFAATWVADTLQTDPTPFQLVSLAAVVGHCYPLPRLDGGGKGVATIFGSVWALDPLWGVVSVALWLVVALVTRYSSLSALVTMGCLPLLAWMGGENILAAWSALVYPLVVWRHRGNIGRLRSGQESKITLRRSTSKR